LHNKLECDWANDPDCKLECDWANDPDCKLECDWVNDPDCKLEYPRAVFRGLVSVRWRRLEVDFNPGRLWPSHLFSHTFLVAKGLNPFPIPCRTCGEEVTSLLSRIIQDRSPFTD
jgi:hypothetical protein